MAPFWYTTRFTLECRPSIKGPTKNPEAKRETEMAAHDSFDDEILLLLLQLMIGLNLMLNVLNLGKLRVGEEEAWKRRSFCIFLMRSYILQLPLVSFTLLFCPPIANK